jgi:hypothetical protein
MYNMCQCSDTVEFGPKSSQIYWARTKGSAPWRPGEGTTLGTHCPRSDAVSFEGLKLAIVASEVGQTPNAEDLVGGKGISCDDDLAGEVYAAF